MSSDISLRSQQQILGSMVGRVKALTDANDISPGSVLLTILEAAAGSDFLQEGKLIQLLNLRNIDKSTGVDLETLGYELGLSPVRFGSEAARVYLTVTDKAFSKVSTNIYAGSTAPAAGDTAIKVVDASHFNSSGTVYLGRNTETSESISYVSITSTGSYSVINLASPLTKDHLVGEEVVLAQGGNRVISSGSVVTADGQAGSSGITFTVQSDTTLLDGENTVAGILAICTLPGSQGNVGRKKINLFQGAPWSTATVTNADPAVGGIDTETDASLRQRIKDHFHTLSGGTERAVIRAVIGASDDEENKRVVSAFLKKPTNPGDQTILFIDDGTGFAPIFSGTGEEVIITKAAGTESFVQLQLWPVVKTQVQSVLSEPFNLSGGERLLVEVDGEFEERSLPSSSFRTPGVVSAQEVAEAVNKWFTTVEARAKDGHLFITPVADDPDYIRVGKATAGSDVNNITRFPTTKQFTIKLYRDNRLMNKKGSEAILQSLPNSEWTGITSSESLQFNIDGIDSALVTLSDLDFANYTSSNSIASATVNDWVLMINRKFIGVTASGRDDGTFIVKSNRGRSAQSEISVIGGTLAEKLFTAHAASTGSAPEFKINRLLGQITLANRMEAGEELKAGSVSTRGFALTNAQAAFNLSHSGASSCEMVLIADAPYTPVPVAQTNTISFSKPSGSVTRITGATNQFINVKPDDWAHFFNCPQLGVYQVTAVDANYSWVDFADADPRTGSVSLDGVTSQIKFFRTEGLPQLLILPTGTAVTSSELVSAINGQILGVRAEIIDSGAIKIQTTRYSGEGALAIPSIGGNARNLGISEGNYKSNDPHTAVIESGLLGGIPYGRIAVDNEDLTAPFDTLNTNTFNFNTQNSNQAILNYLGSSSKIIRIPQERTSSTTLKLRENLPIQREGIGHDSRMAVLSGMEFGQTDNMVMLVDNDPATKTFDIPMYVDTTVSGPSVPSTTEMDLTDATGALIGSSTRWRNHHFEDYRAWFKAKADMPASSPNSGIRLTSVNYGPNGEYIRAGFVYPSTASTPASASYVVDPNADEIQVSVTLESGNARLINLGPNREIDVQAQGLSATYYFLPPVDLSGVKIGDVFSLEDTAFSAGNRGTMRVQTLSNRIDSGHAFEHKTESATVSVAGTTLTLSAVPATQLRVGDKFTIGSHSAYVTAVSNQTACNIGPGLSDGASQSATLTHYALTISAPPVFTPAVNDRIVIGSIVQKITQVYSATEYEVSSPFSVTGLQAGTLSRIFVQGYKSSPVTENAIVSSSASVSIYDLPAGNNKASALIAVINGTAGVKDIITAAPSPLNDGTGSVLTSTEEMLLTGSRMIALKNGQSYVYSTANASPAIRLKEPSATTLEIGESVRLIPSTATNIVDHFSRKQISGLTVAADVELVDQGRRIQVSSKTPGGQGQVFAVGGRASGQNVLAIRGTANEVSSTRAVVELDRSSIELLAPGHTIKFTQAGRAKKKYPVTQPGPTTHVEIQTVSPGQGSILMYGTAFVDTYAYSQSSSVKWVVRQIGAKRARYEIVSGQASFPISLKANDWVFIGDGTSYAGITTDAAFAPANRGWFQVRETDNSTYFDIDNIAVEEYVSTSNYSFIFAPYHTARPGDQLVISYDAPFSTANKGTFQILSVPYNNQLVYANPSVEDQASIALGSSGVSSISILDQGYTTYRQVVMVAPKASDPANKSVLVVSPGYDMALLSEGQGAKITLPNRLGFGTDPVPGTDGYSYWTGLKRKVQRIVDGYEPDSANYPGVGAAGVSIEVREPQIQRVTLSLKVKTSKGVSLQALTDTIKSSIAGYVNALGLGQDVIMSEVIKIVQQIPGVDACVLVYPTPGTERETVGDSSIARITTNDITLS